MMTATATPKVYAAMCAVMEDIGKTGISKDRSNQQQGYKFRGIDDVYNELNSLLAKHKVIILPTIVKDEQIERQTSAGKPLFFTRLTVEFKIVSAEDGSFDTARTLGEAMDSADKSSNKAQSAAYKYAAMMVFCIPTEGDYDADAVTHDIVPQPQNERAQVDQKTAEALFFTLENALKTAKTVEALARAWGTGADDRKKLPKEWLPDLAAVKDKRKAQLSAPAGTREPGDDFVDDIPFGDRDPRDSLDQQFGNAA